MSRTGGLLMLGLLLLACAPAERAGAGKGVAPPEDAARATFGGGCFWCMEGPFEKLDGVYEVLSGYTAGRVEQPSYEQVSRGRTGHAEAVQVFYDPRRVSYEELLEVFWRQIDPTDAGGQFADRGSPYRTGIWVHDRDQRAAAERSRAALEASGRFRAPIVTPIEAAVRFWPAEEYHQDYYLKKPDHYRRYRRGSGRERFLAATWGGDEKRPSPGAAATQPSSPGAQTAPSKARGGFVKPPREELRARLTPLQFRVTQEEGTERPYDNAYWKEKAPGIYVDVVSGEPLYSSTHKYDSRTGWPSFWQPLVPQNVVTRTDRHLGYERVELRSALADSHLGHVFEDGPPPTGRRHCINSAALRFIPAERLEEEGYPEFRSLFEE